MFEHCGLMSVPGAVGQHIFFFHSVVNISTTMAEPTPPPAPEEEQNVVVNPRHTRNLPPAQIKQVLLAFLAGCSWIANNQPILRGGIFRDVGDCFGITQQLPYHK
jgi:hypothetical protein